MNLAIFEIDGTLTRPYAGEDESFLARKDLPAQDVAKAGGWATVSMVEEIYTQADTETTLNVVLYEGKVREAR
jgi:hypothetical protein